MADGSLKFDTKIDTEGAEKDAETLKNRMEKVVSAINSAGNSTADAFSNTGSMDAANAKIAGLVDEIDRYRDALFYLEKQGMYFGDKEYDEAYQKLGRLQRELNDYKKSLISADVVQNNTAKSIAKVGKSASDADKKTQKYNKTLQLMKMSLMYMVAFQAITASVRAIGEGFQNLAQYSKTTNKDLSILSTSLLTLKNSFATAFAPILTAITPALQSIINSMAQAISVAGQFFATFLLGATTFTKAKDAQIDYAAALKQTADQANKTLSPIDKLNNITDGGSEGGYVAPAPKDMFEEVPIDSKITDMANGLKEAIDPLIASFKNLLSGVDWKKLTNAFSDLYNALKPAVVGIGSGIISFIKDLSEFLKPVLAVTADALSTAVQALADVISNVDPETWKSAGYAIGSIAAIIGGIKIVAGLPAFLVGVGQGLGTIVTGLSNLAYLNPVELPALFDLLGLDKWLDELYNMLPDWVTGLWEGFWQIIYDLVSQVFNLDKTFAIWEEVVKAFEDAFDGDTWYEIGWNIIEGIFLGIVGILSFPIEVVANFFETLWNNICKVFGIHSPAEKMKPLGGNILLGILQGFKDKFSDWWAAIVEWGKGTVGQFGVWARSIWYAIQKPFVSVKTWFVDKFQEAWTGIKNVFTSFGTFFGDLWDGIKTGFGDALSKLKDIAKAPLNAIISLMNGMLRGLTAGINALIDAVNSIYFEFPDWVPGLGGRYLGFNIGRMTAPVIPQLATGTVIPPNSEFLALLGDQKKGVNIEAPLDTIVDAFKKVQGDSKSSSNSMLHVTIKLPNGKVLFDSVVQAENENYKSTGQAAFVH